jgi:glycosyltransferase involved in cell wall biosynthesis
MPRPLVFLVPGRLDTRTGGYEYDRRMIAGLRDRGWPVEVRELDDSFPRPTVLALEHADQVLTSIAEGTLVLVDGLAGGAMPAEIERHATRLSIVPVIHSLLAAEIGIDSAAASRFETSERRTLAAAALVVVVGNALGEPLARYGVEPHRIAVVAPGTDRAPIARGSKEPDPLHLVTVATLNPGKGHDVLFRALSAMTDRRWHLTCAGSTTRHAETAERLRSMLQTLSLADRVTLAGELGAASIDALYDSADVAVLPTLSETHSLAAAEALARGIPVVGSSTGAIPDLVGHGDAAAGLVVPPGDVDALRHALARVVDDPCCRARLAEGARRVRAQLPTWPDAAQRMSDVLERVAR